MRFLIWSVVAILVLALVNAIASWFGLDVATAAEEPDAHGHAHETPHHAASHAPAPSPTHAPHH